MYESQHKPNKSQMFAQQICRIALTEWAVPIERLSEKALELLADNAQQRFPEICDVRFRKIVIGQVRVLQRHSQ